MWKLWVETQSLYVDFINEAAQSGQWRKSNKEEFSRKLVSFCPGIARKREAQGTRPWGYTFPPLGECQKAFEKIVGTKVQWARELHEHTAEKKASARSDD
jgi:hypothetical protein